MRGQGAVFTIEAAPCPGISQAMWWNDEILGVFSCVVDRMPFQPMFIAQFADVPQGAVGRTRQQAAVFPKHACPKADRRTQQAKGQNFHDRPMTASETSGQCTDACSHGRGL